MPPPGLRYYAFISHAAADDHERGREWAEWLSESLEDFEVPAALAGRPTPAGPVPKSLVPVFCESRPLGSEGQLDPVICEALEQSRMLVVVCSPRAAQSPEVTEEIRFFKTLGRERVLALIVAGEPGVTDNASGRGGEECLPETLRYDVRRDGTVDREWRVHPVSADVRLGDGRESFTSAAALREALIDEGKSPREAQARAAEHEKTLETAKLKIVAGVLGVPLPDLMRRMGPAARDSGRPAGPPRRGDGPQDVEWREHPGARPGPPPPPRRGSAFGFVMFLLFLALAGGGGWYVWKAQEAKEQAEEARRRAESVLAWMHRDLSEKLTLTSNLPLLAEANERLMSYFQFASTRGGEAIALPALADTAAVAAELALARASVVPAVDYARQAIQLREKAIAGRSSADELEVRLLDDYRRLTRALDRAGRKNEALAQAEATRKKIVEVLQRRGEDTAVLRISALADYERGELLLGSARVAEAQQSFESGLAMAQRLLAAEPANIRYQQDSAEGLEKLGDVQQRKNDAPGALVQYRNAQKILEPLATANPDLVEAQSALAGLRSRIGGVLVIQRNFEEATEEFRKVVQLQEAFAAKQPGNIDAQIEFASALRREAESLLQTDAANRLEALTLLQRASDHVAKRIPDQTNPRVMALRTEIERVKQEAMK